MIKKKKKKVIKEEDTNLPDILSIIITNNRRISQNTVIDRLTKFYLKPKIAQKIKKENNLIKSILVLGRKLQFDL